MSQRLSIDYLFIIDKRCDFGACRSKYQYSMNVEDWNDNDIIKP